METKRVLVAGATGYLGQFLVKELKKEGFLGKSINSQRSSKG